MNRSLRALVIAEWRCLPERKIRPDRWQAPADLLPKVMQRLGLRERLHETEVIEAWSKIVGEFIAAYSAPVALREGVLYVRAPTGLALRARTSLQDRHLAKIETALWWEDHPRRAVSGWLNR
jgi:predicted nucleic acid-binding Zn ribbon protein